MKPRRNCFLLFILLSSLVSLMWLSMDYFNGSTTAFIFPPEGKDTSDQRQNSDMSLKQFSNHKLKPVLIFAHVPKTGGTFLNIILQTWCIATNRYCFEVGVSQPHNAFGHLLQMKSSELNRIDVFLGHIPFGIHRVLKLTRPVKYFTIVRDPVKQAMSAFHYERFKLHYLSGAFALQSAADQLNKTYYSKSTPSDNVTRKIQLDQERNGVISYLTKKHRLFRNAKGCFAGLGGIDGWSQVHNRSVKSLQSMDTPSLVTFAHQVTSYAWNTNCTAPLSPVLKMSFRQYLTSKSDPNSSWKPGNPEWDFGNNPTTAMFCCYHLWFRRTSERFSEEQLRKCPRILNEDTSRCALENMKQIDLVLITEQMKLSLELLERFLNWTIPTELKHLRINEAVYVTPSAPPITATEQVFNENLVNLDRILYQTAVLKFWNHVHSSKILLNVL